MNEENNKLIEFIYNEIQEVRKESKEINNKFDSLNKKYVSKVESRTKFIFLSLVILVLLEVPQANLIIRAFLGF